MRASVNHQYKINKNLEDHTIPQLKLHNVKAKRSKQLHTEWIWFIFTTNNKHTSKHSRMYTFQNAGKKFMVVWRL